MLKAFELNFEGILFFFASHEPDSGSVASHDCAPLTLSVNIDQYCMFDIEVLNCSMTREKWAPMTKQPFVAAGMVRNSWIPVNWYTARLNIS